MSFASHVCREMIWNLNFTATVSFIACKFLLSPICSWNSMTEEHHHTKIRAPFSFTHSMFWIIWYLLWYWWRAIKKHFEKSQNWAWSSPMKDVFPACTFRNGRYLAMAGKSHFIHLWNLESRDLQQVLEMPTVVKSCRQLHFVRAAVPASKDGDDADLKELFLCVLSQDRLIRCIQLSSCQVSS